MPLFEYRCDRCGKRFSFLVGVTAEKAKLRCPKCGGAQVTKLISRVARAPRGEDDDFPDENFDTNGDEFDEEGGEDLDDLEEE